MSLDNHLQFYIGGEWVAPLATAAMDVIDPSTAQAFARISMGSIDEGAVPVAGGSGRPEGLSQGYFVRPTIFGRVTPDMTIAREEIFGPVLCIIGYSHDERAVEIANDTPYGLAAYIQSGDLERARRLSRRLRVGNVHINYPDWDTGAPFGGFKQSGNGREYAEFGLEDFLETKGVIGHGA